MVQRKDDGGLKEYLLQSLPIYGPCRSVKKFLSGKVSLVGDALRTNDNKTLGLYVLVQTFCTGTIVMNARPLIKKGLELLIN